MTLHPMLNTAVKAARRAGNIINRGARDLDLLTVTSKGPKDFVSEVDREAERAIVETLLSAYPDHAILAEEGTAKGANAEAENLWIIDPLDGTTNFLHGFPQYCVSIALSHRGQVTQGVVYDPVRNDLFTASRGRGAFLILQRRAARANPRRHQQEIPADGRTDGGGFLGRGDDAIHSRGFRIGGADDAPDDPSADNTARQALCHRCRADHPTNQSR